MLPPPSSVAASCWFLFDNQNENHFGIFWQFFLIAASETSSVSGTSSATSAVKRGVELPKDKDKTEPNASADEHEDDPAAELGPEGEDTMKNLRKTFAGIFGDIN